MDRKPNTIKNLIGPNQPPTREVKNSTTASKKSFKVTFDFIASQFIGRYPLDFPTQTTPDPSYTSSLDSPHQHQDSSSNE